MNNYILAWVLGIKHLHGNVLLEYCPLVSESGKIYDHDGKVNIIFNESENIVTNLKLTHVLIEQIGMFIQAEGDISCKPPFFLSTDSSWKIIYSGPIRINSYEDHFVKYVMKPKHLYWAGNYNTEPMIIFRRDDGGYDAVLFSQNDTLTSVGEFCDFHPNNKKYAEFVLLDA